MKNLTLVMLAVVAALPVLAWADLADNQVEDGRGPRARLGRPYPVRSCSGCGAGECQVMGMQRFSEPRCEVLSGLGSPCRMWQEPENKTLHLPNGILVCNDVHMQFCPCAPGLVCEEAECRRDSQTEVRADESGRWQQEERESFGEHEVPVALEPNRSEFPWAVSRYQ